jgi:ABC-type lipoprotein export system ATPase subunit
MENNNLIIHLEGLSFTYPGSVRPVIDNLGLKFFQGNRIGIMAPNGSGKTTLFHLMMGLVKPDAGHMEFFGKPVNQQKDFLEVRRRIGFLFQDADDQLFSPTVLEDVAFGPLNLGKSKDEAIDISRRTLAFLGLSGFDDRITFKLSGGEKRLVAMATVLAMEPDIRAPMFFLANGVLSMISDNVFVATVYINEVKDALDAGTITRTEFDQLAVAINTGTNLPSVATPNGQAAFLFLLTSALAPLIRLSYGRMVIMALPYTVVLGTVGLACVVLFI